MTNELAKAAAAHPTAAGKQGALDDIGSKWSKFSKHDLWALKSNADLVTRVISKYGLEKAAAQRQVDAVMKGRTIQIFQTHRALLPAEAASRQLRPAFRQIARGITAAFRQEVPG